MPVKFWQTIIRFWFFLSYLITTVKDIWLDPYLITIFNDLSLTRLSQGHRKQKYANGCHFCTLLEKAMQISFVSFFSCLANRTSRYQKIDASWLVNQLHAPYIQCAVGELYTVMHNQNYHWEIQTFHTGFTEERRSMTIFY